MFSQVPYVDEMNFKKIYIEISNICNLQCSFCPEVNRAKKVMSAQEFQAVITKVKNSTQEIALHLMGEPLAHPEFQKIIEICHKENVLVNLTTNGTHLKRYPRQLFFQPCIKQINFSIHSFKDNFADKDIGPYLESILEFSTQALSECPELYINYRLWNLASKDNQNDANVEILDTIQTYFQVPINSRIHVSLNKSKKIIGRVYFHFDTRFDWPSLPPKNDVHASQGFCYGLKSHIGIHADGTVVPCCLDKEAVINLGNIHKSSLEDIKNSPRAKSITDGFARYEVVEELCKGCTYRNRFSKKIPI